MLQNKILIFSDNFTGKVTIMNKLFLLTLLAFSLSACQPVKPGDETAGSGDKGKEGASAGSISDRGANTGTSLSGIDGTVSYDKNAIHDPKSVLFEHIIYFDFDSSNIREDFVELIKHHGKYLSLHSEVTIRLEGHTDERGSREYNIALADRRAQSIKRLLMFEGASSKQVAIISYGEEKPADLGHDDEAWRLNRRAEFVYDQ